MRPEVIVTKAVRMIGDDEMGLQFQSWIFTFIEPDNPVVVVEYLS
jgi:hypothetical protein